VSLATEVLPSWKIILIVALAVLLTGLAVTIRLRRAARQTQVEL
jgi:hypothetical protein